MQNNFNHLISETELRHGSIYEYTTPDGSRTCEITFTERGDFAIWFNGTYVHLSKTFKPCENKLRQLIAKWDLEAVNAA